VSETLFRLLDPGDVAVDVGAHVGYMTSLMAVRVGSGGSVIAFEPQPDVFLELERNAARWRRQGLETGISLYPIALSNRAGGGRVSRPGLGWDRGGASLSSNEADAYEVPLQRLDYYLSGGEPVSVLKIDVEGHQLEVLQGTESSLRHTRIRDIVFEEHEHYPTPATRLLQTFGYEIFKLDHDLFGPRLGSAASDKRSPGDPSYLATRDAQRALDRLRRRGWAVLRPK
jgi:FkbM family methyltransferase